MGTELGAAVPRGQTTVARPRLLRRLRDAAVYPVAMIVAPAGFGKTTAIRQLLALYADPILISVPPGANSLHQFIRAFADGCADRVPAMAEPPEEFSTTSAPAKVVDAYATWAIAHLRNMECVIAIDDLQNVTTGLGISNFFLRLSEACKPHLQLILASRTLENLPYVHWQAYGLATAAISADDLRMTLDEAVDLARTVRSVATAEQLESWVQQTNGFPIPLSFAIRASATRADADIMNGARSLTFSFLVEHFWNSLGEQERNLLELASILPPMHLYDYANAPIPRAVDRLRKLSEQIAFVTLNNNIFSVHDLLRDFVKEELAKQDPFVFKRAYKTATALLFSTGRFSQAFDVLIESGELQDVFEHVEKYPPARTDLGLIMRLIELSAGSPMSELQLEMLVVQIEFASRNGDAGRGLRAAEEIIKREKATSAHLLCALRAISRFTQFHSTHQQQHWRERIMGLLDQLEEHHQIQAKAHCAFYIARFPDSSELARQLAAEVRLALHRLDLRERFIVQNTLAVMMFYLGDTRAAVQISKEAYEVAKTLEDNLDVAQVLNTLGLMLYDLCDPEVEGIWKSLLPLVEKTAAWRFAYVSHAIPAEYYARQGDFAMSLAASAMQQQMIVVDHAEIEQFLYFRRMCANLRNLIEENYAAVILDYEDAVLPEGIGAAYHVLTILGIAYAFSGSKADAARTLQNARSEREKLNSAWEQRFVVDVIALEIVALGLVGKWNQAKMLVKDDPLASHAVRSLTGALRLFSDGPPSLELLVLLNCVSESHMSG
jgi:hypothetical protein